MVTDGSGRFATDVYSVTNHRRPMATAPKPPTTVDDRLLPFRTVCDD